MPEKDDIKDGIYLNRNKYVKATYKNNAMEIQKCNDKILIDGAKQFFEADPKLTKIFVSPDGQYFKTYNNTVFHCSKLGLQATYILKDMVTPKAVKKVAESEEKAEKPSNKKGAKTTKK